MRITMILTLFPGAALAHPGHITEVAGHNHWLAGAAIGLAAAIAIWGVLKGKKSEDAQAETDEASEEQTDEATA